MPGKDGFFQNVNKFFKRVQNQDLIKLSGDHVTSFNAPATEEENKRRSEFSVFRQYLQAKNWSTKHVELFDEYRKMDATYPIISAAMRIYAQECLTGDCVVNTPRGPKTIHQLIEDGKTKDMFYVESYNKQWNKVEWNMANGVVANGVKPVYKVTVHRNIPELNEFWDQKKEASFKCTSNHKIMIDKNGGFKELKDIRVGDTIFAYYKEIDPSCSCKKDGFTTTTVLNIELVGEEEVYDLFNVAPNHHFSVQLTDSFFIQVHNCCAKDTDGNVLKIITDDKDVKKALKECFFDNLKINSQSYLLVKEFLKFGNLFCFINTRRGVGVTDLIHLPPEAMRIQLLQNAENLDSFKFHWYGNGGGLQFEPWEVVHFKNIEDIEMQPYGVSILRPVVDTWRRIILIREALVIYRITRAPQRFLYKIDTTGMDPDAALKFAEEMKKSLDKKTLINPQTGEIDWKFNPISITENVYMPTFEGDVGGVEILQGASNMEELEDYKIIKDDLFAGLLIPKSYLTFEEDLCLRSNTEILTNEGVRKIKEIADTFNTDKKLYALSCNKHGIITAGKILNCWATKKVSEIYKIHINNGKFIACTRNHPFLKDDMTYMAAEELKIGDKLKGIHEKDYFVNNVEIIQLEDEEWVYDLEVEEYHNFAVSAGVFVHNSNKAALSQEDLRFNNAIKQYQSYFIEGLLHIALVHLHVNGFSEDDLQSFSLEMNSNSTLAEKTRNELLQQRLDLAAAALNDQYGMSLMSFTQVLKEILKFTDEEIAKTFKDQLIEKKIIWRLAQLKEQGFYDEPEQEKKKAMMKGMNTDEDVFSGLKLESSQTLPIVKSILMEKLDNEIRHLTRNPKAQATKRQIDLAIHTAESLMESNRKKTMSDMGLF